MTNPALPIKSGKRIREWTVFAITVLVIIVTGSMWLKSLEKDVETVTDDFKNYQIIAKELFFTLRSDGTTVSQQNRRDIIGMKKDGEYTRATVTRIEGIVKELAKQ